MTLLPACDNAPEITHRRFAHCTDIKMNKQKDDNQETQYYMELICKKDAAESQKLFENKFRKHHGPSGNKQHREN